MLVLGCLVAAVIFVLIVYQVLKVAELVRCVYVVRQIPFVRSSRHLRRAVVREVLAHYPNARTACEIGAGYGGLARYVARGAGLRVTAIENMPFTFFIARVAGALCPANVEYVCADAFKYLDKTRRFDIGLAYLGPGVNDTLVRFRKNVRVLITLDAPITKLKPVRIIDVGHGFTRYGWQRYPHKLFVYQF